ncbi:MAG: UDP-N-acetylmuramate dehydrogenase [bacterium]
MNIEKKIEKNVSLAEMTTFNIGGPAKYFVKVVNEQELKHAILWAKTKNEKTYFLGGGSNVLINDDGVDGLVIKLNNKELSVKGEVIAAGAGVVFGQILEFSKERNLAGLEWAIGIPGTIGGAVRGNAGAYGGCIADLVKKVRVFNMSEMKFKNFDNEECKFSYRHSIFKDNANLIIWQIELELSHSAESKIKQLMDKYLQQRLKVQPKFPSAGCIFKNLIVDELPADNEIVKKAVKLNIIKGGKLACGYIIDQLNFKGKKVGGALVSPDHSNFILNCDKATAKDVKALINEIKDKVKEKFGINLQEEVQYFG